MKIFLSYSHQDEAFKSALESHLALLKRQNLISVWNDRRIAPGEDWANQISENLESANIVLILVSADFIASDYCYDAEMKRAYDLHEEGALVLIPIIVRFCDWHSAPFGRIQGLPKDGKPIDSFSHPDEAYLQVVSAIRALSEKGKPKPATTSLFAEKSSSPQIEKAALRSSNLGVRRQPTDLDKEEFLASSYDLISQYILASMQELCKRHGDIESKHEVGVREMLVFIFRNGKKASQCRMWRSNDHGTGSIRYSTGQISDNAWNGEFNVVVEDDRLAFSSMASHMYGRSETATAQECAEELWSELMRPLQS